MTIDTLVRTRVHTYYWQDDINCATTMLKILAEHFNVPLQSQVIDAALGMHGAGYFGAQCGLVEGALMFLGIYGKYTRLSEQRIIKACYAFAEKFQDRFRSLLCRELRPEGFHADNPPHLCETLTGDAVIFTIEYLSEM